MNPLTTAKLIGAAVLLALAVWGYIVISGWHDDSKKLPAVIAERDKAISDYNNYVKVRKAQDLITTQVSESYEKAIKDIPSKVSDIVTSVPSIRVCKPAMQSAASSSSASGRPDAANADGPSGTHEELVAEVSTEEPAQIAGEAKKCGERLNHLQEWITKQNAIK